MANITDVISDLAITRSLLLTRVANGLSSNVASAYQEIIDDITNAVKTADEITLKNMRITISELKSRVAPDIDFVKTDLQDLAKTEAGYVMASTNAVVGIDIFSKIVPDKTLENIYKTSLIEGATIKDWFSSLDKSMQTDLERGIKLGVSIGETNYDLAKRVDGVLNKGKAHAMAITRTSVATVSNQARQAVWEDNDDVIKGYEHLSTLDSKTSFVCSSRDGAMWDTNGKGLNAQGRKNRYQVPPLHFNSVAKGERVLTISGYKNIEDIKVGDYVLTHKRRFKKVLNTMQKTCDDSIIRVIKNDVGITIRVTDEHPLLVADKGWIRSDALEVGDKLYYNAYEMLKSSNVCISSDIGNPENYPSIFNDSLISYEVTSESISMSSSIAFNNNLSRWNSKISNAVINNKLMNIRESKLIKQFNKWDFTRKLFSSLSFKHTLKHLFSCNCIMDRVINFHPIRVSSMYITSFFSHSISPMVASNSNTFTNTVFNVNRSNFALTKRFNTMLNAPLTNSAITKVKFSLDSTKRLFKPMVMFFDKILSPFKVFKVTHFYTSNVNNISIVAYNDLVYNIEVEDDNSYLVNGVIVHNCRSVLVPVLKSWEALGISGIEEIPKGTRSSLDGQISSGTNFEKWIGGKDVTFQKKYLGAGRYDLWKSGKITFSDLVNQQGRTLNMTELQGLSKAVVAPKREMFNASNISELSGEKFMLDRWSNKAVGIRRAYGTTMPNKDLVDDFNIIFQKDGDYKGVIHRGLNFSGTKSLESIYDKISNTKVGGILESDVAPASWSKSLEQASKFAKGNNGVIFTMKKYSTYGYDIEDISKYKFEQEVLMKPNVRIRIVSKKMKDGLLYIEIEEF